MIKHIVYYTRNNELKMSKIYFLGILIYKRTSKFGFATFD